MQKTILSFGETLWDLLPSGPTLGGAPFNLAYRLNSLGDRGLIVTRLGRDDYGNQALERIASLGMDPAYIQRDDYFPTGTVEIKIDPNGNPDFTIVPDSAYDLIDVTFETLELAAAADCFCFGTLIQRAPTSRLTLSRLFGVSGRKPRFLDINLRKDCYSWETINESLQQATLLKLNADEVRVVAWALDLPQAPLPELCRRFLERCALRCCVVTLGEKGALAVAAEGEPVYVPGYEVPVVDTCGSGDAFSAAFLHAYLREKPLADCCRLGNALGTLVATHAGATTPIRLAEIEQFMRGANRRIEDPALGQFAAG